MAGNTSFRHDGVHNPGVIGLPRVGGPAEKHAACLGEQPRLFQRSECSNGDGGVAGDNPSGVPAQHGGVVGVSDERVAGEFVFFATLEDGLDPVFAIVLKIAGTDLGWCAIHDDIDRVKQLVQSTGDRQAGRNHFCRTVRG